MVPAGQWIYLGVMLSLIFGIALGNFIMLARHVGGG